MRARTLLLLLLLARRVLSRRHLVARAGVLLAQERCHSFIRRLLFCGRALGLLLRVKLLVELIVLLLPSQDLRLVSLAKVLLCGQSFLCAHVGCATSDGS
eukprot:7387619-Prymnesium_polylepis.2